MLLVIIVTVIVVVHCCVLQEMIQLKSELEIALFSKSIVSELL